MAPSITSALVNVLTTVPDLTEINWPAFHKGFHIFFLGLDALWVMEGGATTGTGAGPASNKPDEQSLDHMILPYLTEDFRHFLTPLSTDSSKDMSVYLRAISNVVKKLAAVGATVDETVQKDHILRFLHPSVLMGSPLTLWATIGVILPAPTATTVAILDILCTMHPHSPPLLLLPSSWAVDTFISMWAMYTSEQHADVSGLPAGRGPLRT
ncbi:hypothetical protein B0H14DRAFT_2619566 [Mycena olivaceomarginata]|nr:hypothetical protein B0H14DRAFT_2619566 [Mycena olivaceomarginata]